MNSKSNIQTGKHYFRIKGEIAEDMVHSLATKTFLADWCYLRPKKSDGSEICDLLVVFDNTAIIWQIKDLKLGKDGKYKKSEVEKNIRQLLGARRYLMKLKKAIKLKNPRRGEEYFEGKKIKNIYLVSALVGETEDYYAGLEESKKHLLHVFNKDFLELVLNELDTISDFVDYLKRKEKLLNKDKKLLILGGEEELLAYYLLNGRDFKKLYKADSIVIQEGSWKLLQNKPEYQAKKKEDEISYGWDSIINRAHESGSKEYEKIARELARHNRFERRYLGKAFYEAYLKAHHDNKHDMYRRVLAVEGVTYCFLFMDDPEPVEREKRKAMLFAMCFVARGKFRKNKKVIGIATEKKIRKLSSYDYCLYLKPSWTEKNQEEMEKLQKETGIFTNPEMQKVREEEYPKVKQ